MFAEMLIIIPALLQAKGWFIMDPRVLDQEQPERTLLFGPEDLESEGNPTELKDAAIIRMLRKRNKGNIRMLRKRNKGMIRILRKRNTAGKWRMKRGSVEKGKIWILKRSVIGNLRMSQIVDG